MASMWQRTLFYLGLVDEDESAPQNEAEPPPHSGVRTVDPPGSRTPRRGAPVSARSQIERDQGGEMPPAPGSVAGRRVEPPSRQRRRMSGNPEHAEAGVIVHDATHEATSGAPAVVPAGSAETQIIEARSFTDAQVLADHIRDGLPVVLDLRGTEPAMVRRLVDFATGLTYALDGRMAKTAQGVILVTPASRVLSVHEQERLAERGLYDVNR